MKSKKTFKYCEYCSFGWEDVSPPAEEQYENGLISVSEFSSILLPKKARAKKNTCAYHFDGIYCDIDCLYKALKRLTINNKK